MLQVNFATLIFQIINFLVLVFILYRFLFKPVMGMIAARAKKIEKEISEAEGKKREAEEVKGDYERRIKEMEVRLMELKDHAAKEAEETRQQIIAEAEREAEHMKKRVEEGIKKQQEEALQKIRKELGDNMVEVSSKILSEIADKDLQEKFVGKGIYYLESASKEEKKKYRESFAATGKVRIASMIRLSSQEKAKLEATLSEMLDKKIAVEYSEDKSLVAGMVVKIGDFLIDTSLKGQLSMLRNKYLLKSV